MATAEKSVIDFELNQNIDQLFFRGTSEGFPGSPGLQRISITPVSTDPVVSTIFALNAENYGIGNLYIIRQSALKNIQIYEGNVLKALECEKGIGIQPIEFIKLSEYKISAQEARLILKDMGINLPEKIYNTASLDMILRNSPRLNQAQINEFYIRVQNYLK